MTLDSKAAVGTFDRWRRRFSLTLTTILLMSGCSLLVDTSGLSSTDLGDASDAGESNDARTDEDGETPPVDAANDGGDAGTTSDGGGGDADAAPPPLAQDSFTRVTPTGFDLAEIGGVWSTLGTASVADGVGRLVASTPGGAAHAWLGDLDVGDVDIQLTITGDKTGSGTGYYETIKARLTENKDSTRVVLWFSPNGSLSAKLESRANGATTENSDVRVIAPTYQPNDKFRVRYQALGKNPTTCRAKIWKVGSAEPSAWQLSATVAAPELQADAEIGFEVYASTSATTTPFTMTLDDLIVRDPKDLPP